MHKSHFATYRQKSLTYFSSSSLSYWLYALNHIPSHTSCMHTHKSNKLLNCSLALRTTGTEWFMFQWLETSTPQKCMAASKLPPRNGPQSILTSDLSVGTVCDKIIWHGPNKPRAVLIIEQYE